MAASSSVPRGLASRRARGDRAGGARPQAPLEPKRPKKRKEPKAEEEGKDEAEAAGGEEGKDAAAEAKVGKVKGKKRARIQAAIDLLTCPDADELVSETDLEYLWDISTAAQAVRTRLRLPPPSSLSHPLPLPLPPRLRARPPTCLRRAPP